MGLGTCVLQGADGAAADRAEAAAGALWLVGAANAVVRAAVVDEQLAESVVVHLGGGRDAGGGLREVRPRSWRAPFASGAALKCSALVGE